MPYARRSRAVLALATMAVAFVWAAPRVSASGDDEVRVFSGVQLVNDVSRRPILGLSPVTDGTVIDLGRLTHHRLSLQATVAPGAHLAGVAFTLSGASGSSLTRTESRAPYFLCGDYVDCPLLATPDDYSLTAQALSATGTPTGRALTVRFTVASASSAATAAPPLDVLFVGNSLIGTTTEATGEDTPDVLSHLAAIEGRPVNVTKVIHFGYTLRHTWSDGLAASALDGRKQYDFIVLQELSILVVTNLPAATDTLLNLYAPTFRRALKPGGRVVLFKNWVLKNPSPFRSRAAAKTALDANYAALSAALATPNLLAPIGDEFETVISAKGASHLIVPDGKHPTEVAVYLDAVTLFGILFAASPRDLPSLYLPADTAAYLRSVAATAIGY
ncbi:MAG: hypothetical protein HOU81_06645 [Hamadaea sp.]|uniref:hypothetical protein n=1 Tax=Hamadaea sp. TaxID=2024425 RepID=UPI0017E2A9C4|nr:hypothetical protein [Hamadaea sp.]NUR70479.1 hypothetical protein [Hamadaea sp.]NUT18086.1 hypothetical protein [Hamadaea sp.]